MTASTHPRGELVLSEHTSASGDRQQIVLVSDENGLAVRAGAAPLPLPAGAVEAVMQRYGRPLAQGVRPAGSALQLPDGGRLQQLRFRPTYDVIARDYLVLERPAHEPLAELSATVAAALLHLAERLARSDRGQKAGKG